MYTKRLFASVLAGTILASGIPFASATTATNEPDLSKLTVTTQQEASASIEQAVSESLDKAISNLTEVSDPITYTDTEVTYQGVTFKRQQDGVYAGLPLFDANPDHINQYLDVYMDYIGLDGIVRIGIEKRNDYTLTNTYTFPSNSVYTELAGKTITWENKNAGKVIPGSPQFNESVQGYSTNFPAQIGVGQTWNKDLVAKEGNIVGTEKLYDSNISNTDGSYLSSANVMVSTALTDIRTNPLSGRIDESYAEDPYLASQMVNAMAGGVTGHDQAKSDDGFWQMAFVDTKHFTNYLAQWQRNYGSFFNSARGLIEYMAKSTYEAFENDNIGCFMTTYGTTNYVPNGMSPMINYVKEMSNYPISTINDNGAETAPVNRLGNDYMDTYWPTRGEQIISQAFADASAGYQQRTADSQCDDIYATVYAIQTGKMGMTVDNLKEQAKGAIINQIRCGLLNERDKDGNPIGYPFLDVATSGEVYDYTNKEHQQVALQMAEECAVLLKNDNNLLPLSKDTNVTVTGPLADVRFTTTYAGTAYAGENMGLTPLGGIMELTGKTEEELGYTTGAKKVKLKDSNGNYVKINGEEAVFDLYAWGQDDSISLKYNDQWVTYDSKTGTVKLVDDAMHLGASAANESNGKLDSSTMPANARREWVDEEAGTFRLLANTFTGGFFNEFEESYYTEAAYLTANGDTELGIGCNEPAGSVENVDAVRTEDTVFTQEVVSEAGAEVQVTEDGVAIVVVGVSPKLSAGEGTDRVDLDLGAEQYELCHNVAAQYPGKTVVVVKVSSPVNLQPLQDDKNIGAILYQPYAGQYEGLALGNLLFGEAEPSGRLTNTWYNTTDVLPQIDSSIIHNGWAKEGVTLEDLDPARDVLMTNGDPYDTQLTYMYNKNDGAVTYEFGYGLSYGDYEYRGIQCSSNVSSDKPFTVTVEVANLGDEEHYEVVQLYAQAVDSPYGDAAAEKQLVAFEKVLVPAVSSAFVELTVDPQDLAVYTAQNQDLTVLSGKYKLMAGSSSENIQQTKTITVNGEALEALDATGRTDVFASAYAADDVYYREYNRQSTIDSLKADEVTEGYYSVVSKNEGSWVAVANVNLQALEGMQLEVAAKDTSGTIEVHLGSPDGTLLATAEVPKTDPTTYVLEDSGIDDNADVEITEQAFVNVDAKINADVDVSSLTSDNLYFVFKNPELRLASFQLNQGEVVANSYTVTFNTNGGNDIQAVEVEEGKTVSKPQDPTKSGYTFAGWFTDEALTKAYDFNSQVTADITLYAKWTQNSTGGGSTGGGSSSGGSNTNIDEEDIPLVENPTGAVELTDGKPVKVEKDCAVVEITADKTSTGYDIKVEKVEGTLKDGVLIALPTTETSAGTVAVIVDANGKETVVKNSYMEDGKLVLAVDKSCTIKIEDRSKSFTDVSSNYWGKDAIAFATSHDLFNGTSETQFSPQGKMNRAMIVTVLARLAGVDTTNGSTWYEAGVNWAKENGISDGTNLNASVSREQLATMLYRYAGSPKVNGTAQTFTDSNKISSWASDAMNWAIQNGLISGMGDGTVNPQGEATRAQVATIIQRFIMN